MPRRNIGNLPFPSRRYRIDKSDAAGAQGFESSAQAAREDAYRADRLPPTLPDLPQLQRLSARHLEGRLSSVREAPASLASSQHMRIQRIKIAGAMWRLVCKCAYRVCFFTLIPRGYNVTAEELGRINPEKVCAALRSDLNRCGAAGADGFLIAFIHGEYEIESDRFQLHFHGLAGGGMIKVVDALRKRHKYRSGGDVASADGWVKQRVRIEREPLYDMPAPLTYVVQSFWPARRTGEVGDGEIKRTRAKGRIRGTAATHVLLWLDQFQIHHVALSMKLRVTKKGLRVACE